MKHELKNYSSAQINNEWRIKVKGVINGVQHACRRKRPAEDSRWMPRQVAEVCQSGI